MIGCRSSGAYSQLNVGPVVYLGGLPRLSSLNPTAVKDVTSQRDFEGCFSHFKVCCLIISLEGQITTKKSVRDLKDL